MIIRESMLPMNGSAPLGAIGLWANSEGAQGWYD